MVGKDTEVAEHTEKIRHRDTETPRHFDQNKTDLCVSVSPWRILSVFSRLSVSEQTR
jgi:hypothetical protein